MSAELQTIAALVIVALTVGWFLVGALTKKRKTGCGDSCGAVSREVKDLQTKLRTK